MSRAWTLRERAPERMVERELQGGRLDRVGDDRLDQRRSSGAASAAGRRDRRRRGSRPAWSSRGGRRAGAGRCTAPSPAWSASPSDLVLVEPGERRLGRRGGCHGRGCHGVAGAAVAARSSHSATADRAARQAASAFSAPIRAESASRLRRSRVAPMAAAAACSRGRRRARVAGLDVDPVDLVQPVARRGLEGVGVGRGADGRPEGRLGRVLRLVDRRADRPARTP